VTGSKCFPLPRRNFAEVNRSVHRRACRGLSIRGHLNDYSRWMQWIIGMSPGAFTVRWFTPRLIGAIATKTSWGGNSHAFAEDVRAHGGDTHLQDCSRSRLCRAADGSAQRFSLFPEDATLFGASSRRRKPRWSNAPRIAGATILRISRCFLILAGIYVLADFPRGRFTIYCLTFLVMRILHTFFYLNAVQAVADYRVLRSAFSRCFAMAIHFADRGRLA